MTTLEANARAEILSLPPGDALDHYVAEVFFRWHASPDGRHWHDAEGRWCARRVANSLRPHAVEPPFQPSQCPADADRVWQELARRNHRIPIKPGFGGRGWQTVWQGRALEADTRMQLVCWCALLSTLPEGESHE